MRIEFEVDEKTLTAMAHDAIRSKLGPGKSAAGLLAIEIDRQFAEVIGALDLRPVIRAQIDNAVRQITSDVVNNRLRGIAKTIVNQEIEKARASARLEAAE